MYLSGASNTRRSLPVTNLALAASGSPYNTQTLLVPWLTGSVFMLAPIKRRVQDYIRELLRADPDHRMAAAQARTHPWLLAASESLKVNELNVSLARLRVFSAKRKLRMAVKSVSPSIGRLHPPMRTGRSSLVRSNVHVCCPRNETHSLTPNPLGSPGKRKFARRKYLPLAIRNGNQNWYLVLFP